MHIDLQVCNSNSRLSFRKPVGKHRQSAKSRSQQWLMPAEYKRESPSSAGPLSVQVRFVRDKPVVHRVEFSWEFAVDLVFPVKWLWYLELVGMLLFYST